ncbi:hypothetical protein ACHQM5_024336 [Ranunculus cassubicifolius]
MTSIKHLPSDVYSTLRSTIILFDLARVVEELIYNSIDAGAAKVIVDISVGDCYVKVEDDGCGITRDGMGLLGEKYATSKLHSLAEMDVASENFGFRGETLGSLSDVALLEVTTKARGRPTGYRKIIKGCKCLYLGIDDNRQDMGTTVVVRDLFYNQPVRRKYMQSSPKKILHSVKKCVLRVALVHPQLSFKVTDIESGDEIFYTHSLPSPLPLVSSGFGNDVSRSLCELNFSNGIWDLSGYISAPLDTFSAKAFQFVYINSRFVCKGPIHKLLNNLTDSSKSLDVWKGSSGHQNEKKTQAYILNLRCPRSEYDLTFEPSKTMVEFKDWVNVLSFIEKAIRQFWRQTPAQGETKGSTEEVSVEGAIWKNDDNTLSPIQDLFTEDSCVDPEIPRKKRRVQQDQNFPHPSPFSQKIASEESEMLLHPNYHSQSSEILYRNKRRTNEQGTVDYFHQTDNTSQDISRCPWDAFYFKTTPVVSQEHYIELWPSDNDILIADDNILSTKMTGRQSSENNVNYNMLGSRCNTNFLEVDLTVNERFTKRLPSSNHDENNDVPYPPTCLKGPNKPFLRHCSSLRKGLSFGNVFPNHQESEIGNEDKCWMERSHQSPDDVISAVDDDDSDHNLDMSTEAPLSEMFATSSCSSSVLTRHHTATDLSVRSTDFTNCHPTKEVGFTEGSNFSENSPERYGKGDLYFLSKSPAWNCISPYSAPQFDCSTCASNEKYTSCRTAIGCDLIDEHSNNGDMMGRSNKNNPDSSCTDIDIDHEHCGEYLCESPIPRPQSADFLSHKNGCYNSPFREADWLCFDSSVENNINTCATPTMPITSPCYQENRRRRQKQDYQCREQPSFFKERSRRSHSAPPFYKGKGKFSTIYNCVSIEAERESSSPQSQGNGKRESGGGSGGFSPVAIALVASSRVNPLNSQYSTSNEAYDSILPGVKWRNGIQQTGAKHEPLQNEILDISCGILHLEGGSLLPTSISKECLEDTRVLLQLDKKFIPVVAAGAMLAVIDQHAADERIRVEELRSKVLSGEGKSVAYLDSEQDLVLPESGYQLLQNYAEQIQNWGWICDIQAAKGSRTSTITNLNLLRKRSSHITLRAVPCILGVNLSDKDLIEFLDQLAETDGSSTMPPSVIRVVNYKACRGAIMFGDALLPSECSLIIHELSQTSLCFQCAHGRPTTVPLVKLDALHKQIAKMNNKRNSEPWHGLQLHRPTLDRAKQRLICAGGQV